MKHSSLGQSASDTQSCVMILESVRVRGERPCKTMSFTVKVDMSDCNDTPTWQSGHACCSLFRLGLYLI